MDIPALKHAADRSLAEGRYSPRRLALIHGGAALTVSLVLSVISYLLSELGPTQGGINGMGAQSLLSTVQTVLRLAFAVMEPFWQVGFLFAALGYVRGWNVELGSLFQGFRRFKPLLSSGLLRLILYMVIGIVSMYASSMLYLFMPFAAPMYEAAMKLSVDPSLDLYTLLGDSAAQVALGYGAVFLVVYGALSLPVFYRCRMTDYIILDQPEVGGIKAVYRSWKMMRRRSMELFKVDLSFWWFYVLELLLAALSLGDVILGAAGVTLPVSGAAAYWGFLLLSMAGQLALYCWAKPKLEVTYAHCYEALKVPPEPKLPKNRPPKAHPWND